ncbi:NRDE family protein [Parasphingorhabdus sp.]|uniref:NRDE family protein n=1 Tax=Parasphingorhabdus sp. TaxID=2709688 RepID=UPI003003A425
MCIISLAWQAHPRWQLVAIGNRDEMHARPAAALERWPDHRHLLAGRDIQAGGTWLGVSERGRFAAVTNLAGHGPPDSSRASRGDLLKDFLTGEGDYANLDAAPFAAFNPFNLVTVAHGEARLHSNRPEPVSRRLAPGIHGLTNGPLDRPWPKAATLNRALANWLEEGTEEPGPLLDALASRKSYPRAAAALPGPPAPLEPASSAIFIDNPVYGTRCSTVLAIDRTGAGWIRERRFDAAATVTGEDCLRFRWPL